jgi:hypothetical protein
MSDEPTRCPPELPFLQLGQGSNPYRWITVYEAAFYPDRLDAAIVRYKPILERFAELVEGAESSVDLLRLIMDEQRLLRGDLLKLFARYVSPTTKTELLKRKGNTESVIENLGQRFRPLPEVRMKLRGRPKADEAIIAILDEHSNRGQSGYRLTEDFFRWFEAEFGDMGWSIEGPRGAGKDLDLRDLVDNATKPMPVDFAICDPTGTLRVIGFARYDTDRGGSQEDDRIGGNVDKLTEISAINRSRGLVIKALYLNDGLGLTLGSMWRDYGAIETVGDDTALVTTLKMAQAGRVSLAWLNS